MSSTALAFSGFTNLMRDTKINGYHFVLPWERKVNLRTSFSRLWSEYLLNKHRSSFFIFPVERDYNDTNPTTKRCLPSTLLIPAFALLNAERSKGKYSDQNISKPFASPRVYVA